MQIIDNTVSQDERKRKYTDRQIMKILVLPNIFEILYTSAGIFLRNHEEYLNMIGQRKYPHFRHYQEDQEYVMYPWMFIHVS